MPRSKRNKVVSLTKTRGKGRAGKTKLVEELRNAIDEYKHIYVFSFENLRASMFKDIRAHFRESR
jgi:mRNA turnover protein 4